VTTILYIRGPSAAYAPMITQRMAGLISGARKLGWRLHAVDVGIPDADLKRTLAFWQPAGCVVEGGLVCGGRFLPADFAPVPAVYIDTERGLFPDAIDEVRLDSDAIVRATAKELLSLGFPNYAYVGHYTSRDWSRRRAEVFAAEIHARGLPCHVFEPGEADLPSAGLLDMLVKLRAFVQSLPRPCGLLGANDEMGDFALLAARHCGIDVPFELAVMGIDNDELHCENTEPTLSSVSPDFERSGELAVRLLARRLADPAAPHRTESYGQKSVVRRQSTHVLRTDDPCVMRGIERIRLGLGDGVRVADVAKAMGLGLRTAQKRFLAAAGRSIDDEIRTRRLARARELLVSTDRSVADIAEACGYADERALRYLFLRQLGTSPTQFRRETRRR